MMTNNNSTQNNKPNHQTVDIKSSIPVSAPQSATHTHSQLAHTTMSEPAMLSPQQEKSLIQYNHITYLLYAISFFTAGILWIVPIVLNYARRHDAKNSWLETHFDWQIKTFWYSIAMGFIGITIAVIGLGGLGVGFLAESSDVALGSTGFVIIGCLIFLFAVLWHLYRVARGWIALTDKRAVP